MRTDALIIEGPEGFDPTEELCGYPPMNRQIKTMQAAKPYRVLIAGDRSMAPVIKKCTRLGADFMHPGVRASAKLVDVDSLVRGLTYLQGKCDRVLIAPANYPFINTATYERVMASETDIAITTYNGERGWPVLISASFIPEILQLGSLDAFLATNTEVVTVIETDDLGTATDVCAKSFTKRKAEIITKNHSLHQLRLTVKLAMAREIGFYGSGIIQMLRLIDEAGTMVEACRMMGMAETHGWKIVNRAQNEAGVKLLKAVRSPAVGMVLTPAGRAYAERFERWREKAESLLRQSFAEEFSSYE